MVGNGGLTLRFAYRGFALNASHCSISARELASSNRFGVSNPLLEAF